MQVPIQPFFMGVIVFCLIAIVICGVRGAKTEASGKGMKVTGPAMVVITIICIAAIIWLAIMGIP